MTGIRDVYQAFALRETSIFGVSTLLVIHVIGLFDDPQQDFGGLVTGVPRIPVALQPRPPLKVDAEPSRMVDLEVAIEDAAGASQLYDFDAIASFDVMETPGGDPLLVGLQEASFKGVGERIITRFGHGVPELVHFVVQRRVKLLDDGSNGFRNPFRTSLREFDRVVTFTEDKGGGNWREWKIFFVHCVDHLLE